MVVMHLLFPDVAIKTKGTVNAVITLGLSKAFLSLLEKSWFIEKNT